MSRRRTPRNATASLCGLPIWTAWPVPGSQRELPARISVALCASYRPLPFTTMAETAVLKQLPKRMNGTSLSSFRYLHYDRHVQGGAAARAPLSGRDARALILQVDVRRHRMGADRTVDMTHSLIRQERLHDLHLILSDALSPARVLPYYAQPRHKKYGKTPNLSCGPAGATLITI